MSDPTFSIIVPVYNVEQYLRQCLDSVLAQSFTGYECIMVDDGSPDTSPVICDEYAARDKRFKVIHKENGGLSDARNMGINSAVGGYIVLLDSDDLLADNEALKNLRNIIEETKAEVVFNSNLTIFREGSYTIYDGIKRYFLSGEPIQFYTQIMRNRKIVLAGCLTVCLRYFLIENNIIFRKGVFHEDELWMPLVFCSAKQIAVNHSPFYTYRRSREGSIMTTISPKRFFDKLLILQELLSCVIDDKRNKVNNVIYTDRCFWLWYGLFISVFHLDKQYPNEGKILFGELRRLSYILLYQISIKKIFLYVIMIFIGYNYTMYVHSFRLIFFLRSKLI